MIPENKIIYTPSSIAEIDLRLIKENLKMEGIQNEVKTDVDHQFKKDDLFVYVFENDKIIISRVGSNQSNKDEMIGLYTIHEIGLIETKFDYK